MSGPMTADEIESLGKVRRELIEGHAECVGTGVVLADGRAASCDCQRVFELTRDLIYSQIPPLYRRSLDAFQICARNSHAALRNFLSDDGASVLLVEGQSVTTLLASLAQYADGALYLTADDLVSLEFKSDQDEAAGVRAGRLKNVELLLLDDVTRPSEKLHEVILSRIRAVIDGAGRVAMGLHGELRGGLHRWVKMNRDLCALVNTDAYRVSRKPDYFSLLEVLNDQDV